ncbi:hypothetical protein N9B82_06230, partial [Saprospiraceae bacterium]|nr:hypothetical protein [Saprospiraceae bacterium]
TSKFYPELRLQAQDSMSINIPYHQIPDTYQDYSSGNVIARMIDGLGYRYYWASENLSVEALAYQPSDDAADMMETMKHLFGLSETILNTAKGQDNVRPYDIPEMSYEVVRSKTLHNLMEASKLFRGKSMVELEEMKIVFARGDKKSVFPVWQLINGPIADAIYHTGQVVSFRRTAGNPINAGVNVFTGKTRE